MEIYIRDAVVCTFFLYIEVQLIKIWTMNLLGKTISCRTHLNQLGENILIQI